MKIRRVIISLAATLMIPLSLLGADDSGQDAPWRPVMAAYTYGIGSAQLADTYLTPLKYNGWAMKLGYERMQAMRFDPEHWVMRLTADVEVDRTDNPARNANMWYGGIDMAWGMMYRWRLLSSVTVGAGGSASLSAGCLYSPRNGNNPVAAKAAITVNAAAYAAWNVRIKRLPVTLRYQATLPVTGAFFSPDYGELYYEIYLGNHSGLAHCAWWGNYFRLDNLLTADMHFGATSLRIGYAANILSTKVNDITSRAVSNMLVIGLSGEWISLDPRRRDTKPRAIISALF